MYSKFETSHTALLAGGCKSEKIENGEWIKKIF